MPLGKGLFFVLDSQKNNDYRWLYLHLWKFMTKREKVLAYLCYMYIISHIKLYNDI